MLTICANGQEWAVLMMVLLKDTWRIIKQHQAQAITTLSDTLLDHISTCYDDILEEAHHEMAQLPIHQIKEESPNSIPPRTSMTACTKTKRKFGALCMIFGCRLTTIKLNVTFV